MLKADPAFQQRHAAIRIVVCLIAGAVMAVSGKFGVWVSLFGVVWMVAAFAHVPTPRRAFWQCWWIGFGYFAVSLRWIVSPFLVEPDVHGWMAPFALFLMAAGAAVFWGLAGWAAQRLRGGVAMLALMLVAVEILRSLILTGFPWALLGHKVVDLPVAQLAAWGGPHLLTMWFVLVAYLAAKAYESLRYLVSLVVVFIGTGLLIWDVPPTDIPTDAPIIRLVQPNAPQDEKWDIDKREVFFDRMLSYSAATPRPDLIVWPETAVPQLMPFAQPRFEEMAAIAGGVPIVSGVNRFEGETYHNSLVLLDAAGAVTALYDKQHLVPFGEYVPFGAMMAHAGVLPLNVVAGFTPGRDTGLIDLPGIGPARALICYEGIFAEEIATSDRPRLMVLITNDAWFGRGLGPRQHLAQARLRAIEQGVPMVRVANTGISAMIDARGRITGQIGLNEAGYLDLALPAALPVTPYARFGDWPVIAILLLLIAGIATRARRLCD